MTCALSESDLIHYRFSRLACERRNMRLALKARIKSHPLNVEHGLLNRARDARRSASNYQRYGAMHLSNLEWSRKYFEESVSLRKRSFIRELQAAE